ncbi:hypothetical protein NDA11_003979 [Ustilago hordei]|uniref:Uncharacterized protein n=1 Tax=Ustilago hordei TaxID=120017 RepID=I2G4N2_USTHO|nr:uncharacterized protein UHO2_01269 [Ustilago hordei]KAJ1044567.1 hypothetical protein NDA10_001357 [Ustilago hordei]KAJ1583344.1 hypothetical protein NDA15_002726 [Ustilago hordei]KAJ1586674.1 hypothetical protein NDA11_003979 [Ustilago hordei]KAJ1591883.1 hypothetical protein NDA12_003704 [Ustilago hordei]KAJ1602841.1 hypothetical protein NDA14_001373 [Ustilago hordei]
MISDSHSRGLSATKRAFTRPANLHLAWSTTKSVASPFSHSSSFSSATPSQISITSSSSTNVKQLPFQSSPIVRIDRPLSSHPYSSFVARPAENEWIAELQPRIHSSMHRSPSTHSSRSSLSRRGESSKSVLKSGHLTWKVNSDSSGRKGALSGFEKALRRRQAVRDHPPVNDKFVFVKLYQEQPSTDDIVFTTPCYGKPASEQPFASEPFLASPGACDPSAFDNDGLSSLISPPIPSSLSDLNRWVPPPSWDVFASASDDHDSQSRSSSSSASDPLQTPQSSNPGSPKEREILLDIHWQEVPRTRRPSGSHDPLLMRLRITHESTAEIQSSSTDVDNATHYCDKQLVVTGELVTQARSQDFSLEAGPQRKQRSSGQTATCILSSPNLAELKEWLFSIEDAIIQCKRTSSHHFHTLQSDGSILDTIRLHEESEEVLNDNIRCRRPKGFQSAPMASSRSLPSASLYPSSAAIQSARGPDFSPSTFIDYYAASSGSTTTLPNSQATTPSTSDPAGLYDFEDAYASILARFSDYDISSPLDRLPSAPLDGFVQHARSGGLLDVPVSPCNSDFQECPWEEQQQEPTSPLDPWLTQHGMRVSFSVASACMEEFADKEVMKIFAEGFRRRSSAGLPADSHHH